MSLREANFTLNVLTFVFVALEFAFIALTFTFRNRPAEPETKRYVVSYVAMLLSAIALMTTSTINPHNSPLTRAASAIGGAAFVWALIAFLRKRYRKGRTY